MSSKSAPIIVYFAQGAPPQKNQHNWPPLMSVYNYEGRKNDHLMQLFSMLRKNLGKAKELLFKKSFEGCKIFCFRGGLQKVEFLVSHVQCTLGLVPHKISMYKRKEWCQIFYLSTEIAIFWSEESRFYYSYGG